MYGAVRVDRPLLRRSIIAVIELDRVAVLQYIGLVIQAFAGNALYRTIGARSTR